MAANTVIAQVKFQADTKELRQGIQSAMSELNKIASMQPLKFDSSELKAGVQSAKDLRTALQAALSTDMSKINMATFSDSLKKAGTDLSTIKDNMSSFGVSGERAFQNVTKSIMNASQQSVTLNQHFSSLLTNLKKTAQWQISSSIIHGFVGKLHEAVGYAQDLNQSLNNIQIVTQMTNGELAEFASQAQKAAKALSSSTLAFSDAALIYFQQGDEMTTAMKKAEITMKAAAISFNSSAKDMSEYLTAIWNSYQVGEEEMQKYVDIMANLGANTATSMEEISTALKKVAATANNVGVDMEQMSTIIATSASVTRQSAEIIGTAWNTILSRIGGLKLGETLEDGVDLNKYSKALKSVGIDVLDASGNLREMGTVIDEIGAKWNTMSKAQQSALAQTIGGTRQYTQMMAFFDNYKTYEINLKFAEDSEGTLDQQFATWEQSWEAATGRMKNAWQGLYSEIINDKTFIGFTDVISGAVNAVTELIDSLGGIVPVLGLIGSAFMTYFANSGGVSKMLTSLSANLAIITGKSKSSAVAMNQQLAASYAADATRFAGTDSGRSASAAGQASLARAEANRTMYERTWSEDRKREYQSTRADLETRQAALDEARTRANVTQNRANRVHSSIGPNASETDLRTLTEDQFTNKFSSATTADKAIQFTQNITTQLAGNAEEGANQIRQATNEVAKAYDEFATQVNDPTAPQTAIDAAAENLRKVLSEQGEAARKTLQEAEQKLQQIAQAKANLEQMDATGAGYTKADGTFNTESAKGDITKATKGVTLSTGAQDAVNKVTDQASYQAAIAAVNAELDAQETKQEAVSNAAKDLSNSIGGAGGKMQQLACDAAQAKGEMEQAGEEVKKTGEKLEELSKKKPKALSDSIAGLGSSLVSLGASVTSVISSFNTLTNPDTSGTQKLVAVFSLFGSTIMMVNSAIAVMNGLKSVGASLAAMHAAAITAETGVLTVQGTVVGGLKILWDKMWQAALGPIGAVILGITAVIGIFFALKSAIEAANQPYADLQKRVESLDSALDKQEKKRKTVINDVAELGNIMNDTTLSYESQIEQINKIASAYGIQADAIDVLSGSYERLKNKIQGIAKGEAKQAVAEAEEAVHEADEIITTERQLRVDNNNFQEHGGSTGEQWYSVNADTAQEWASAGGFDLDDPHAWIYSYGVERLENGGLRFQNNGDDSQSITGVLPKLIIGDWEPSALGDDQAKWDEFYDVSNNSWQLFDFLQSQGIISDTSFKYNKATDFFHQGEENGITKWQHGGLAGSLFRNALWTGNGYSADGKINGLLGRQDIDMMDYLTDEGSYWFDSDWISTLEGHGFTFDKYSGLSEGENGGDLSWLAEQMFTNPYLAKNAQDSNTFTGQIYDMLSTGGYIQKYRALQNKQEAQLVSNLFNNENFDITRSSTNQATGEEYRKILADSMTAEGPYDSWTQMGKLIDMTEGFGGYSDAQRETAGLYSMTTKMAAVHGIDDNDLKNNVFGQLASGKVMTWDGDELTLSADVVLQLNPSDIEIGEDSKVIINEAALAYAQDVQAQVEATTKRETLQGAEDVAGKKTLTDADLQTLFDTGEFETWQDVLTFASQSQGQRQKTWSKKISSALTAEGEAMTRAQTSIAEYQASKDEQLEAFYNNLTYELEEDAEIAGVVHTAGETLTGEDAYTYILDKRDQKTAQLSRTQTRRDMLAAAMAKKDKDGKIDTSSEEYTAYTEAYGAEDLASVETATLALDGLDQKIVTLTNDQDELNQMIAEGEEILVANNNAASQAKQLTTDQQTNAWEATQRQIKNANDNLSVYNGLLGKNNKLTADELATLRETNKALYDKYMTEGLTDEEWDEAVYQAQLDELTILENLGTEEEKYAAKTQRIALEHDHNAEAIEKNVVAYKKLAAEIKKLETEATNFKAGADVLTDSVEDGKLTSKEKTTLAKSGIDQQLIKDYEAAASAEERMAIAAQVQTQYLAKEQVILEKNNAIYDEILNNSKDAFKTEDLEAKFTDSTDFITKFFSDVGDEAQGAISEAFAELNKNGELDGLTNDEVWAKLEEYFKTTKQTGIDSFEAIKSTGIDTMKSIYASASAEAQKEAQNQITIWENAFSTIASLRTKLLKGEDIGDDIFGDYDKFMMAYTASGAKSSGEFFKMYNSGQLNLGLPDWQTQTQNVRASYGLAGPNSGLITTSEGKVELKSANAWINDDTRLRQMEDAYLKKIGVYGTSEESENRAWYQKNDANYQAQKSVVSDDVKGYAASIIKDAYGQVLNSTDQNRIISAWMNGDTTTEFQVGDKLMKAADIMQSAAELTYDGAGIFYESQDLRTRYSEAETSYNKLVTDNTAAQALIEKVLQSQEGTEKALTKDEQIELAKYLGVSVEELLSMDKKELQAQNVALGKATDDATVALGKFKAALYDGAFEGKTATSYQTQSGEQIWSDAEHKVETLADSAGKAIVYDTVEAAMEALEKDTAAKEFGGEVVKGDDGKYYIVKGGETTGQVSAGYESETTTNYEETATENNTTNQEAAQSAWISARDSELSALDTLQKALDDTSTKAETLTSNWESFYNTLDMTNPAIATAYEHLQQAANGGYDMQTAINEMTDALLRQGDIILTDTEELRLFNEKMRNSYEITDATGKTYSLASLNALRLGKTLKSMSTIINTDLVSALKKVNKTYTSEKAIKNIAEDAKKANKSFDDYVDSLEDLSAEEKSLIKDTKNLTNTLTDLGTEADLSDERIDDLINTILDADDLDDVIDDVFDAFDDKLEDTGSADKLSNWVQGLTDSMTNGLENFRSATAESLNLTQEQTTSLMETVINAIEAKGGNLKAVNWGEIANEMGVDVSYILQILQEYLAMLQTDQGLLDELDISDLISRVQQAINATKNFQGKHGGGGGSNNANTNSNTSTGGGGSKSKTKKDKKDATDETERYHEISEQLGIIQRELTRIDKIKSSTWGASHLKAINQEIAALEKEAEAYQAYADEAADWLAQDQAALAAEGGLFNDDGSIANYTDLMQQWVDEYNKAVETFNNSEQTDADTERFEQAEELFEDRKKMIENYEESYQKYQEQINNYLDTLNKLSAARLEKITYKVELQVELNESDRKVIDYFTKKIEESLSKQSERMSKYIDKQKSYESDAKEYADAIAKLEEEHQKWIDSEGKEGINESDYATTLKDYRDKLTQTLSDMYDNAQKIKAIYSDTIDLANEKLEEHTNIISHAMDMMTSYIEIMGLMGKKVKYDDVKDFYENQYEASLKMINVAKKREETWKSEIDYYQAKLDAGQTLSEVEEEQYKKAKEEWINAQNDVVSNTKTALQNLQAMHQAYTDQVLDDLSRVGNGSKATIQDLSDAYNRWNEETNRYLATGKQLYEINKLNRQIEDSIVSASTKASKERLAALEQEINAKAKSSKLSEYQIKQYQLQYQLALAVNEMEEAANAKSTVRLVRDENGGYGYQYTADQDEMDAAQQHYEDVLEQIRELSTSTADQMAQGIINAKLQLQQALSELRREDYASEEEYKAKRDEIIAYYTGQMNYYSEQYQLCVADMQDNLLALSDHYGEENINVSEEMSENLNEDVNEMIEHQDEYVEAVQEAVEAIDADWAEYQQQIDAVTQASGLDYASMISSLTGFQTQTEKAQAAAEGIITTLQTELDEIHDVTDEWNDHEAAMQATIEAYEDLIDDLGDLLDELADLQAALDDINDSDTTHVDVTTTTTTTPSPAQDDDDTPSTPTSPSTPQSSEHTHNKDSQMYVGSERHYKCSICGKDMGPVEGTIGSQQTQTQSHGSCFAPGTQIMMADGSTKAIEDIKLGDYVTSYNIETGKFESQEVIQLFAHTTERLMRVTLIDGTKLDLTPSHPILTLGGWRSRDLLFSMLEEHVEAKWLEESDIVIKYEANVGIASIEELDIPNDYVVYNFKVDNTHTYIAEGIVVHNMVTKYASGGLADYTGPAWVDGTFSKPELVLSPSDTFNLLQAIEMLRDITPAIMQMFNSGAMMMSHQMDYMTYADQYRSAVGSQEAATLEQEVHITAEFPSVTDHNEIEEAFNNLIDQTAQYISRDRFNRFR